MKHKLKILSYLSKNQGKTRYYLMEKTDLPRTTIHDILTTLENEGLVRRKPLKTNNVGRPRIIFYKREIENDKQSH